MFQQEQSSVNEYERESTGGPLYNAAVRSWDAIIIGGGIIGLSLSIQLRKRGMKVLVVERGEPGREASSAAGGMLADCGLELPAALQNLATASARMYPEFVHEIEHESGMAVDLRSHGTILFPEPQPYRIAKMLPENPLPAPLSELEPGLVRPAENALLLMERSVDPRALTSAVLKAARHREVDFSSGDTVTAIAVEHDRVAGVLTEKTSFAAPVVVNCAGAWAGQIAPPALPTRPVKGQMLCLVSTRREILRHVIRTPEVYLIPRSDGRIVVGATLEEAGFDKRTDPETIRRFHRAALELVPELSHSRIHEDWAGLRPATPDALPILGEMEVGGYFAATGHFRDGILLAPVTARAMAGVICDGNCDYDLTGFAPSRFRANAQT